MYKRKEIDLPDYRVISMSHDTKRRSKRRARKEKQSSEAVKRFNEKLRREKLQVLILANFREGDLFVTLTYEKEKRPKDIEEAKENIRRLLRKLKGALRKLGHELKWISTTEIGSKGACHHHLILTYHPGILDMLRTFWVFSPTPKIEQLYRDGAFARLSDYIVKTETKEGIPGTKYSRSRNLYIPKERTKVLKRDTWEEIPKAPKGWVLIKESLTNGVNPCTGFAYQRYILERIRI